MVNKEEVLELSRICLPKLGCSSSDNLLKKLSADDLKVSQICSLWGGMGHIYKVSFLLDDDDNSSSFEFVIKHITPPSKSRQSFGDRRKALSYIVEANFYETVAETFSQESSKPFDVTIPRPLHVTYGPGEEEILICMSLLDGEYFNGYDKNHVKAALRWLASFHATFWGKEQIDKLVQKAQLQPTGSYWHLDTRPDEHQSLGRKGMEGRLKAAARAIDGCLKRDPMQCLVHGDVKDSNIMFLEDSDNVGMYDFQYCGKGCPTQDLAYFFCTAFSGREDEEEEMVEFYHENLAKNLKDTHPSIIPPTLNHLKLSLEVAYADFYRFILAWGLWGNDISGRVCRFMDHVDNGKHLGSEDAYEEAIKDKYW